MRTLDGHADRITRVEFHPCKFGDNILDFLLTTIA